MFLIAEQHVDTAASSMVQPSAPLCPICHNPEQEPGFVMSGSKLYFCASPFHHMEGHDA
jgi:hypothetical protein